MSTKYDYVCTRTNDDGGTPAFYSCTLELFDDALVGSSGTWSAKGPDPKKIFVVQSGKWAKASQDITLDSDGGAPEDRVIMKNADGKRGHLIGDGLVGGNVVNWERS